VAGLVPAKRRFVEVKIGIQSVPRELVIETEASFADVEKSLTKAIADGGVFSVKDVKGGKIMVPAEKLAYVEIGGTEPRRVGFGPNI
jgi:hypothetical protein